MSKETNHKKQKTKKQDTNSNGAIMDSYTQTEIIQRDYVPMNILKQFNLESEAFPSFLYRSHTLTGLVGLVLLIEFGIKQYGIDDGPESLRKNGHLGLQFSAIALIIYGMIYLPNTIMQRPHPAFWRLVHAIGLFYLMMVVFANFYSQDDLQRFLKVVVDPNLGQPLPQKTFAEDCRLFTPEKENKFYNISHAVDIFFLAHICGWMFKMIITRDLKLCMIQSIIFEILEITFRHWLPNFWECWWDHIILDLILCNTGGMLIGLLIIKVFKMKQYRWSLRKKDEKKSYLTNFKELFTNINLEDHHWQVFSSAKRFLQVLFFMVLFQMIDLSFFFNKFVLDIKENHGLCVLRTFLMGFLAIPSAREYYEYLTNKNCKRLGPYCWNLIAILVVEAQLFLNNMRRKQFDIPFPWYVKAIWAAIGLTNELSLSSIIIFNINFLIFVFLQFLLKIF
ncbi:hypothetical protein PPERSA_10580 [Pseudocohnilembus persalinus]|uniref:Phosphatidyl serine synthase n=1 Tax=Pseudocohnilembus persalinus TaxID=266149 RepID=A0A0V0Q9A3_PSEPJ|nr:hypothetical protein PPERSA_10580 [Pseudocohnilembus persalinus]|eukprot:KRW98809.1 hypothetical protein PPERSA_10580 [Pseudocohnilembus persalinus]